MKCIGKFAPAGLLGILLSLVIAFPALGALEASVDRDRVALGDTLQLTLKATGAENLGALDLNPLLGDFQILQQSTRSSTRIVNGRRESSRELVLQIAPRRAGTLRIPALPLGNDSTNMLLVSVGPAPETPTAGGEVFFEAELDRESTWVQGQVILTLRLHQAINLESRSITDLKLDNAYVHTLSQNSFQRQVQGRPFLITEIRYAIFPEQSGTLTIPSQTFTAREASSRRSLFDTSNGRLLSRTTEELAVTVRPRPDTYPAGATWLPAEELTISESWSSSPEQLEVGESATRRITLSGRGLQGAQLPPVESPDIAGIKIYPDQPQIEDTESDDGLLGNRTDSAAFIPTTPGTYTLPQLRVPWWDSRRDELRWAVLPERQINVIGAAAQPSAVAPELTAPVAPEGPIAEEPMPFVEQTGTPWMWIAVGCAAGWLLTLIYLLTRRAPAQRQPRPQRAVDGDSEKDLFRQVMKDCKARSTGGLRQSLPRWAAAALNQPGIAGLHSAQVALGSETLSAKLRSLDEEQYSRDSGEETDWDTLTQCLQEMRRNLRAGEKVDGSDLSLYPST